ncbi:hypothetical protein NOR53_301 [gamma proteobacterium NOR5-3]|nr:hypothetical protein NOR53_301 [gamma proteobacterium NOR5-3]
MQQVSCHRDRAGGALHGARHIAGVAKLAATARDCRSCSTFFCDNLLFLLKINNWHDN